jgi:hypothetical protein
VVGVVSQESTAKDDLELQEALGRDLQNDIEESRQQIAASISECETLQATISGLHEQLAATVVDTRLSATREAYCKSMSEVCASLLSRRLRVRLR